MKKLMMISALAVAAVACTQKEEMIAPEAAQGFTATVAELGTKTTAVDNGTTVSTNWVAEDAISVFNGTTNVWFSTSVGGATANFLPGGDSDITEDFYTSQPYAIYPYNADATISENTITTSISKRQYGVAGDFPSNQKPLLITKGDAEGYMTFSHATAVLKFTISAATVGYVSLYGNSTTAEYIAGKANVTLSDAGAVTTTISTIESDYPSNSVTLMKEEPTEITDSDTTSDSTTESTTSTTTYSYTALDAGTYYMVIAPQTFTEGITLEWSLAEDNSISRRTKSGSVTFEAGKVYDMGTIDLEAPTVQASPYNITMTTEGSQVVTVNATDDAGVASLIFVLSSVDDNNSWTEVSRDTVAVAAPSTSVQHEYTFSYATEGSYYLSVYATDVTGKSSDWYNIKTTISTSTGDNTAPTITLISDATATVGTEYTLKIRYADETELAANYQIIQLIQTPGTWGSNATFTSDDTTLGGSWAGKVEDGKGFGFTPSGQTFDVSVNVTFPSAGEYWFYIYCANGVADTQGNTLGKEPFTTSTETANLIIITVTEAA